MKIVETFSDLSKHRLAFSGEVALIPTMGALHEGHLALIRLAKSHAKHTIVSIFVNPTQFGPNEDFESYPRSRTKDLMQLEKVGVDIVFFPTTQEVYPNGIHEATRIYVPTIGHLYCGKSRPTFFEGVCSIVLRLFLITKPTHAVFGEKDFQQVTIIKKMITDLYLNIKIIQAPIVREDDGLAMSSRNQYLSEAERQLATEIYNTLIKLQKTPQNSNIAAAIQKEVCELERNGIRVDYLSLVEEGSLREITKPTPNSRVLFAGYIGKTRLIDNMPLTQTD
jgi:pantoate--beta-alanine ligase